MTPERDELVALHDKYERLLELSRAREEARARGLTSFPDAASAERKRDMRALATRFPGALRELDALGEATFAARRDELAAALAGAPLAPWIEPLCAYHALLAHDLRRRWCDEAIEAPAWPQLPERLGEAAASMGPGHRDGVLATVAARFGFTPDALEALLFGDAG